MKKIMNALAIFSVTMMLFACNNKSEPVDTGPTNEDVGAFFTQYFKDGRELPDRWYGGGGIGYLVSIEISNVVRDESIKKLNGGSLPPPYNSSCSDCWPVSMHARGVAVWDRGFKKVPMNFEDNISRKLCRTYENKWKVYR